MRQLQLLVLLAVSLCLTGTMSSAEPIGPKPEELTTMYGIQFSISAPSGQCGVETPIEIDGIIKNVTNKPLSLGIPLDLKSFRVEVTTQKGEPVPLTRYGQILYSVRTAPSGMGPSDIGAGVEYKYPLPLNRIYDMTVTGEYLVKVKRVIHLTNEKDSTLMTSNVLSITVR